VRNRFVGAPARTEVAGKHLLDENPELHEPGLIHAELPAYVFDLLGAGNLAREDVCRIAADPVEKNEHQQNHAKERRDHLPEPPDDIGCHRLLLFCCAGEV